ncbi:MAG: hypothetical protein QW112_03065 [Candidatus Micrarchaeia archaeon]
MPTIKCKEKLRNARRMRDRLKRYACMTERPMTRVLDIPGEMIRETRIGSITKIRYCDKAHGGSPVTFIIDKKRKSKNKTWDTRPGYLV